LKTLYKYIFATYLGPMFLTLFIVVFIFLIQYIWLNIDDIVGKGLKWNIILELLGWYSVTIVPMSLPLSTLLASLMTMGNLGENNELLALKASGVSLNKILNPLYYTIVLVAVGSFFLSSEFAPYANLKVKTMLQRIRRTNPELSIPEDIFYNGIKGFSIRVNKKDPNTGALIGVMVYDHTQGEGNISVTIADTGYIQQTPDSRYILFRLINGTSYSEELVKDQMDRVNYPFNRRSFSEQIMSFDMGQEEERSFEFIFKDQPIAQSLGTLNKSSDSLSRKKDREINKFREEKLDNTSAFKHSMTEDTIKRKTIDIGNIDSAYTASTATQKLIFLAQAEAQAANSIGSWDNELRSIQKDNRTLKKVDYERHRKFTLAFACIIFFFIGAPLGAIIRKGGLGLPVVISIFFFVFFWVLETICGKMVTSGSWAPFFGAWFSSFVFVPLALFLTYKANTDSQLFNPDAYKRFLNRLLGRMKKLIVTIDLDKIIPMAETENALTEVNNKSEYLTILIDDFLQENKLNKLFKGRDSIINMHENETLAEIKTTYDYVLSYYASIDDNEKLRQTIKYFPLLNPSEFAFPKWLLNSNIFLKAICTIILEVIKIRKFKKLEYMLKDIKDINLNVNKYINGKNKA